MTRRCLRGACVAALSWDAITSYLQAGARPVFTIGAAAKEHGLHLPMDTDFRQAQWLGNAIASRWPVLVWPPIGYGHYPAFLDFPGSVSVNAATFGATIANILESVEQFQQVTPLIVNTGMSTIAPL